MMARIAAQRACAAALLLLAGLPLARAADATSGLAIGERIYRAGLTAEGKALQGQRSGGASLTGPDAACVNCHRRSGLGTSEGKSVIPPIAGDWLFRPRITNATQLDRAPTTDVTQRRPPYTPETLARALREGIGSDGQTLSVLMPRYPLSDAELRGVTEYLRTLGSEKAPGVDEQTLHFATIVTPEAEPRARDAMLAVLRQFFQDRNHIIAGSARPMQNKEAGVMYRVTRAWQLHEWVLSGPPDSWDAQLRARLAAEPVFAVVSGLGGAHWQPVHDFCEHSHLPCLFPNVDVPVVRETDFYNVYFSRGLLLEAALLADAVAPRGEPAAAANPTATTGSAPTRRKVVQVVRRDTAALAGAEALAGLLAERGVTVETRQLTRNGDSAELTVAVSGPADSDLVLWLDGADLARLPEQATPQRRVWASGLLGGLDEAPLPSAWQPQTEFSYPIELPARRAVAMKLPEGWFRIKNVPVTDARVQFQTYVACQILSEGLGEVHINFLPDYLLERLETMLSHRRFNGLYPRLSLGVNQRFASKGGYLVHLGAARTVVPDGDWRIP